MNEKNRLLLREYLSEEAALLIKNTMVFRHCLGAAWENDAGEEVEQLIDALTCAASTATQAHSATKSSAAPGWTIGCTSSQVATTMTTDGTDVTSESRKRHSTKRTQRRGLPKVSRSMLSFRRPMSSFLSDGERPRVLALVRVHHRAVERAGVHEVVVRARADHAPLVHDDDEVGGAHGFHAVGDD